jgi:hypothetical protein
MPDRPRRTVTVYAADAGSVARSAIFPRIRFAGFAGIRRKACRAAGRMTMAKVWAYSFINTDHDAAS